MTYVAVRACFAQQVRIALCVCECIALQDV